MLFYRDLREEEVISTDVLTSCVVLENEVLAFLRVCIVIHDLPNVLLFSLRTSDDVLREFESNMRRSKIKCRRRCVNRG